MKHVQTGMCINDTRIIQGNEDWGNLTFVELSSNCLDPAAQFRFRHNGAMLNLKRPGCLSPQYRAGSGHLLDIFYIYVSSGGLDGVACSGNVDGSKDPAITQTPWGGLSVEYKGHKKTTVETWCAVRQTHTELARNQGVDPIIRLTTECSDVEDNRFNFGKFLLQAYLHSE